MPEENKINQEAVPSQPVEDVFSNVGEANTAPAAPVSPEPVQESVDISEKSIGQEEAGAIGEPQVYNPPETEGQGTGRNKIFFYAILVLIIILGSFAVWALLF